MNCEICLVNVSMWQKIATAEIFGKPWDSTWACKVVVVTPEADHRNKTLASLKSGKHQRCLSNHTSSSKTTRGLPLNFSIDPAGCNSLTSPSLGLKPRG